LASFPLAQRRALYPTLDADSQSALRREQIELYLESHPDLPARAWLLLTEAREALTPELFADLRHPWNPEFPAAQKIVRALEARARDELSPEERAAVFGRIGPAAAGERAAVASCFLWICEVATPPAAPPP
jgi:hypothetical protein